MATPPKNPPVSKAQATRAALEATFQAFLAAAISFAEEAPEHVHETIVGDFRVRYLAGEVASIGRR